MFGDWKNSFRMNLNSVVSNLIELNDIQGKSLMCIKSKFFRYSQERKGLKLQANEKSMKTGSIIPLSLFVECYYHDSSSTSRF